MNATRSGMGSCRRWRSVLCLVAACFVAAVQSGAAVTAAPAADDESRTVPVQPALPFPLPPLPPELDPGFYAPPADIVAAKKPGEIIAAREVHLAFYSVIPFNIDAWQLSFRSTNTRDEAIAAVTTVMKPRGDNGGKPRNLLSYQFPQDSNAQYCGASYLLQLASFPASQLGQPDIPGEFVAPLTALGAGWAVTMPDHEGPNSAFAAGPLEGQITLDGIRATENFAPMGLPGKETKVGMAGYSGGAIATDHAAELHASYAPELNIVGAVAGGNQADMSASFRLANNFVTSGLIWTAVLGAAREYPELDAYIQQHMNPVLRPLNPLKNALCLYSMAIFPFMNLEQSLFDTPDPLHNTPLSDVLEKVSLGHAVPDMPIFLYQSNRDEVAPVEPVTRLVQEKYCADPKARVLYVRDNFSEHLILESIGIPRALLWLEDRFNGVPVPAGCDIHEEGSMALDPATWPVWLKAVDNLLAGLLQQPIGSDRASHDSFTDPSRGAR
ncbi:lipase family protein [Nocardia sp. NBC_01499]|uniref:lipase family protein n=1 Tax=Nocardia sp. NBC_01499 TaxID=2903597 RepID=UPI0038630695